MRADDLRGFGPVGTNGPTIAQDLDTMRDVYMLPSQQAAFDRIAALARAVEAAPVRELWMREAAMLNAVELAGQRVALVGRGE
jgi:hypothetical protein